MTKWTLIARQGSTWTHGQGRSQKPFQEGRTLSAAWVTKHYHPHLCHAINLTFCKSHPVGFLQGRCHRALSESLACTLCSPLSNWSFVSFSSAWVLKLRIIRVHTLHHIISIEDDEKDVKEDLAWNWVSCGGGSSFSTPHSRLFENLTAAFSHSSPKISIFLITGQISNLTLRTISQFIVLNIKHNLPNPMLYLVVDTGFDKRGGQRSCCETEDALLPLQSDKIGLKRNQGDEGKKSIKSGPSAI